MEISSSIPKSMPSIPNDVIFEILSWAPANSVMRFRWACKYWFDLIKDPKFVKMHFLHHSTTTITNAHEDDDDDQFISNTSLLMTSRTGALYCMRYRDVFNQSSLKKIKLDFYDCIKMDFNDSFPKSCFNILFLGSCNGLTYFDYYYRSCHEIVHAHFIWNPPTRELKEFPQPNIDDIFLPGYSRFYVLGFGYDHTIEDYKVIRVEYYESLDVDQDTLEEHHYSSRKIDVYTLGSNSWSKKVEITDYCYHPLLGGSGLFVNGALHWIMRSSRRHLCSINIISFDMAKEEHGELQLPDNLANIYLSRSESGFIVLNGNLVIFCINGKSDDKKMDVWMMKDYGVKDSWTKLFTINMKQLLKDISQPSTFQLCYLNLLKYHKDAGRILMVFNGKYIIIYDLKKEKRSKLIRYNVHKIEDDGQFEDLFVGATYIETLVSLNSGKYLTVAGSRTTTFQKHKREDEDLKKNKKKKQRV